LVLRLIIIDIEDGDRYIILVTWLRQLPDCTLASEGRVTSEVVLVLEGLETPRASEGVLSLRLE
jgi:hypothetical protein